MGKLDKIRREIYDILKKYGIKAKILSIKKTPKPNVTEKQVLYEGKMKIYSLGILGAKARNHVRYKDLKRSAGDILKALDKFVFEYSFFKYPNNKYALIIGATMKPIRVLKERIEHVVLHIHLFIGKTTKTEKADLELYASIIHYRPHSRLPSGTETINIKIKAEPPSKHKSLTTFMG